MSAMKKRITAVALAAVLMLSLCGCTGLFYKEYFSVSDYTGSSGENSGVETKDIADWAGLKAAVKAMVADHLTEGKLIFTNYDGDLQSDLAQVGWTVKSEDALSDYCVDYISCDLNSIITYYEAQIHIKYKHTSDDVLAIIPVAGLTGFESQLSESLNACADELCVQWYRRNLTEEDVASAIQEVYYSDPASCVVAPNPQITVHSSSTGKNIVEIVFYYGYSDAELQTMKAELKRKMNDILSSVDTEDGSASARYVFEAVVSACEYTGETETDSASDSSVYDALVSGSADSLGMALAFSALCRSCGIECSVVSGALDSAAHYWNIIDPDGYCGHVDVSYPAGVGTFMQSDTQMLSRGYVWDSSAYPECAS